MIVLDEPLSSLDASAQAQIANLLVRLSRELNLALVLISHDLAIVQHIADQVAVMYLGKLVETVPSRQLWELPAHPYTEALVNAIPRADGERRLPLALAGEVPDPSDPPSGLPLPPALPVRVRPLPGRGAAGVAGRRRAHRRLLAAGGRDGGRAPGRARRRPRAGARSA